MAEETITLDLLGARLMAVTADVRDLQQRVGTLETRFSALERRFSALENRYGVSVNEQALAKLVGTSEEP